MKFYQWLVMPLLGLAQLSSATIIDFEGLANGTIVNNQYTSSLGVTINGHNNRVNQDGLAVVFNSNLSRTQDPDLESPFSNIKHPSLGIANPGNILIIHENPNSCSAGICTKPDDEGSQPAGFFTINFGQAVTLNSIDFFDIETLESDKTWKNIIRLYDFNNNEIQAGQFYTPTTGGDNHWDRLFFGTENVYSMRINLKGSGAIDNINYTSFVPESSSMALLLVGLLGLCMSRRRKI